MSSNHNSYQELFALYKKFYIEFLPGLGFLPFSPQDFPSKENIYRITSIQAIKL